MVIIREKPHLDWRTQWIRRKPGTCAVFGNASHVMNTYMHFHATDVQMKISVSSSEEFIQSLFTGIEKNRVFLVLTDKLVPVETTSEAEEIYDDYARILFFCVWLWKCLKFILHRFPTVELLCQWYAAWGVRVKANLCLPFNNSVICANMSPIYQIVSGK